MKQFYAILFFFMCFWGFSQEKPASQGIDGLVVFPNPVVEGRVFVETAQNAPKRILIADILGTLVLQTNLVGKELDLSSLDQGLYILQIFEDNKAATRKLIVK